MTNKRKSPPKLLWIFWMLIVAFLIYSNTLGPGGGDRGIFNVFIATAVVLIAFSAWLWALVAWRWKGTLVILLSTTAAALLIHKTVSITGVSAVMIPEFKFGLSSVSSQLELPEVRPRADVDLTSASPEDFPSYQAHGTSDANQAPGGALQRLARDWKAKAPEPLWRQPVGTGWGGFSVVHGVAVDLEERQGKQAVIAYDLHTGEVLWTHSFGSAFSHPIGGPGPRSTPAIAQGLVVAHGPRGELLCLNGADGSLRWSHDLMAEYGVDEDYEATNVGYGRSNSPLVVGNKVIIPAGGVTGGKQAGLVAFDLLDGQLLWEGPARQLSYVSPVLAELAGMPQILITNEASVSSHDVESGALLWEHPWPGRTPNDANNSQPRVLENDRVWISKGYGLGAAVLQISREGGAWKVAELWHNKRVLRTKFTSAVIHAGHAYGLSDGILECVDLETGERVWKAGRYGHGQLMLVDGLLLILSEAGELVLVEASPIQEALELGRVQAIEGKTWNHFALVGDRILVRNAEEAAVYKWPSSQP